MKIQWNKNGDHPDDDCGTFDAGSGPFSGEGKIVRYYRHPFYPGTNICLSCNKIMYEHGWIDSGSEGFKVCPGNYIFHTDFGYFPAKTISEVAMILRPHMQCNCDLDKWEPERSTGHSSVCRIHKKALELWNY